MGEIGNTSLEFDLSGLSISAYEEDGFRLIIDTDTDFTDSATVMTASSYSSTTNIAVFDAINLADGDYFTIGVSNNILSVAIVDGIGVPVANPSIDLGAVGFSLTHQTSIGVLGTTSERVRVSNSTAGASWTLSIAASSTDALWTGASSTYDFNDSTAGAGDGSDSDGVGGQLTINPFVATITPQFGCSETGISKGTENGFSESVNSITLLNSDTSADTNCTWDLTNIDLQQTIPYEQPPDSYQLDLTLSIISS